jgi:hypothetical protein
VTNKIAKMQKSLISPPLEEELSDQEMEEMMAKLIEGQHVLVNLGNIPDETPPWLDMKKYEAGKQFVKKYYGYIINYFKSN